MKNAVGTIPMAFFHARNCPERSQKFHVISSVIGGKVATHRYLLSRTSMLFSQGLFLQNFYFPKPQKEIIAFLKRLNRIYASDIQAELQVLYKKMLPYESHPYERRPFFYLDIISWLESKIRGVTVAEVIQEKFRRSLERHKMKKNAVKDVLPVTE